MSSNKPRFLRTVEGKIVLAFVAYFSIYVGLSCTGEYRFPAFGEADREGQQLLPLERIDWYPAGVEWRLRRTISNEIVVEANLLGWFFLPLLWFDRQIAHPTEPFDPRFQ